MGGGGGAIVLVVGVKLSFILCSLGKPGRVVPPFSVIGLLLSLSDILFPTFVLTYSRLIKALRLIMAIVSMLFINKAAATFTWFKKSFDTVEFSNNVRNSAR